MSNVYGAGPGGPFAGGAPPQYTPNQLLAQQYGQGSRAFYSPFNSPYRPQGVPAAGFNPVQYAAMGRPPGVPPPPSGNYLGNMGFHPGGGMSPAQASALEGGITPWAMAMGNARYGQGMPPGMFGQGQAPGSQGGFAPAQAGGGFGGPFDFGPGRMSPQFAQQNMAAAMQGPPPQSGAQYGLDAMRNFASQQNAGPPPSGYQPGSFSAGVAALNRGNPNAQNMLGQAAGLPAQSGRDYGLQATQNFASQQNAGPPPAPAQPFGPAFRNAVNQLQVRPPAAPQRLPYQPGATAQMMQLGRRAPGLPATNQAGRTSGGIQPASGMAPPPPRGSDRGDLSGYNLANVDPSRIRY
jgi:hypothetical protein